jgi:hypothetical protein
MRENEKWGHPSPTKERKPLNSSSTGSVKAKRPYRKPHEKAPDKTEKVSAEVKV